MTGSSSVAYKHPPEGEPDVKSFKKTYILMPEGGARAKWQASESWLKITLSRRAKCKEVQTKSIYLRSEGEAGAKIARIGSVD